MCELSVGDFVGPETRIASTEDPEVCFNLLIDTFCFTVGLKVVRGGER